MNVTSPTYSIAVVGAAGTWGQRYLAKAVSHSRCVVAGIADTASARRERFANHYGIQHHFETLEDLLSHQVPDLVVVSVPVAHNPNCVISCAGAGVRAIACEKPVAVTLREADAILAACREHHASFVCSNNFWNMPHLFELKAWLDSNPLGELTSASIPRGLPGEMAGFSAPELAVTLLLTGRRATWVEGEIFPPPWEAAPGVDPDASDCPGAGQIGLEGDIVCTIPHPPEGELHPTRTRLIYENGRIDANGSETHTIIESRGNDVREVYPPFATEPWTDRSEEEVLNWMIRTLDRDEPSQYPGALFCEALEIAVGIKTSALHDHERLSLPIPDRTLGLVPRPHRYLGGDAVGWDEMAGGKQPAPPGT